VRIHTGTQHPGPFALDQRRQGVVLCLPRPCNICAFGVWSPFSPLSGVLGLQVPPPAFWGILVPILATYLALAFTMRRWLASRISID